jgi:hypothetical protein
MNVLVIVELVHNFEHALLSFGRDVLGFVEHTGYGRRRDSGFLSHLPHGETHQFSLSSLRDPSVHKDEQEMLQFALNQTDSPEIRLEKMRFLQPIAMFWMNLSRIRGEGHGSESGKGRG